MNKTGRAPRQQPPHFVVRPDRCPRCGGAVEQEPFATHCRMCGSVFYLVGVNGAQSDFERRSGISDVSIEYQPRRLVGTSRGNHGSAD